MDEETTNPIESATERNPELAHLLHEREIFHFQNVVNERLTADGITDPAEMAELEKAFHERLNTKNVPKTAAAWVAAFEDVRAERKAAKNAPPPAKPWKTMSDEEFAKEEAAIKAEKRAAKAASDKAKRQSFEKATKAVLSGTDDEKAPDWLNMSDEEFARRDAEREKIRLKRILSDYA